jgi:uncharacterized protein Usg
MCKKSAPPDACYVYAVTRQDLPQPHLTVQVAHAAIAATNTYGRPNETHPHLVVCTVFDERELANTFERLKRQGVPCCAFYEDDLDGALTAVATAPLRGDARRPLQWLRLLR